MGWEGMEEREKREELRDEGGRVREGDGMREREEVEWGEEGGEGGGMREVGWGRVREGGGEREVEWR